MRAVVLTFLAIAALPAQTPDPNLVREVDAVRNELARSFTELLKYTWLERTEVLVGGKPRSSTSASCGYDRDLKIVRTPLDPEKDKPTSRQTSNRPSVRSKGEMQDYIERAISRIRDYVPLNPEVVNHLVQSGQASLMPPSGATTQVRMTHYYQDGDSLVFTYDTATKRLQKVTVSSNLNGRKDPVTLDALFSTLPGNVTHLDTATLLAPSKKVQVTLKNVDYRKLVD
jgi:hypothetical protein